MNIDPAKGREAYAARQKEERAAHDRRRFHAVMGNAFGREANETAKGLRNGLRHSLCSFVTDGRTDSSADLEPDEYDAALAVAQGVIDGGTWPPVPTGDYRAQTGGDVLAVLSMLAGQRAARAVTLHVALWTMPSTKALTGQTGAVALVQALSTTDHHHLGLMLTGPHAESVGEAMRKAASDPHLYADRLRRLLPLADRTVPPDGLPVIDYVRAAKQEVWTAAEGFFGPGDHRLEEVTTLCKMAVREHEKKNATAF